MNDIAMTALFLFLECLVGCDPVLPLRPFLRRCLDLDELDVVDFALYSSISVVAT